MNPWHERANDLSRWALAGSVNRTDAWGKYYLDQESNTVKLCCEKQGDRLRPLDAVRLQRHFQARDCYDVVGLYSLGTDSMGRWAAVDVDRHDETVTPDQTRAFAIEVFQTLRRLGFHPLLTDSDGKGGYHLRCFFREPVEGEKLFRFARWMTKDWRQFGFAKRPESFPKQPAIGPGKFGNWLRLVGRHHKRDHYPTGFDGREWLDGMPLIEHMLKLPASDPARIPREALDAEAAPVQRGNWTHAGRGEGTTPWEEFDKRDEWEPLLEMHGWRRDSHSGEIQYFTRPGRDDGVSASLGHKRENGIRLFYSFTCSTALREGRYYTPSAFLAIVQFNGDFKAANRHLRELGYGAKRETCGVR